MLSASSQVSPVSLRAFELQLALHTVRALVELRAVVRVYQLRVCLQGALAGELLVTNSALERRQQARVSSDMLR